MLTRIEARNFKCFSDEGIRLDLAPITVLVGPNGSGKSSVLESIGLLAQSAQLPGQVGFRWRGPWVDFGDGRYAFRDSNLDRRLQLRVTIKDGEVLERWQSEKALGPPIQIVAQQFEYRVTYVRRTEEWSHELMVDAIVAGRYTTERVVNPQHTFSHRNTLTYPQEHPEVTLNPSTSPGSILSNNLFSGQMASNFDPNKQDQLTRLSARLGRVLDYISHNLREQVFLVGVERALSEPEIGTAPESMRVGKRGEGTLPVLSITFASNDYRDASERIRHWADVFGLKSLLSGWTGEKTLSASFRDQQSDTTLPTRSAGFGSQQILPIIAQLFAAPKGSLIMIEEPEISLHPEAQVQLLEMFADAVQWGQQILVTTHSQTLLLALSTLGKQSTMKPDNIAVYHFFRDRRESHATRLTVNERWYIEGWVPSFANVEERLTKDWMESVRDRIKEEG